MNGECECAVYLKPKFVGITWVACVSLLPWPRRARRMRRDAVPAWATLPQGSLGLDIEPAGMQPQPGAFIFTISDIISRTK